MWRSRLETPSSFFFLLSNIALTSLDLIQPTSATTPCYRPDGSLESITQYQPCASDPSNLLSNICCITTGRAPPGSQDSTNDECLPNGLCMNRSKDSDGQLVIKYARGMCTENDWSKGGCSPVCGTAMGYQGATPCDGTANSTRWCCGSSIDCCIPENNLPVYTLAASWGDPVPTGLAISVSESSLLQTTSTFVQSSTTQASTTSPSSQSSASPSATPPATSERPSNTGLSTGAKAGIAIGATLGALILIGVGALIARSSRWYRTQKAKMQSSEKGLGYNGSKSVDLMENGQRYYVQYGPASPNVYAEMDGSREPREMLDEYGIREMEARM